MVKECSANVVTWNSGRQNVTNVKKRRKMWLIDTASMKFFINLLQSNNNKTKKICKYMYIKLHTNMQSKEFLFLIGHGYNV